MPRLEIHPFSEDFRSEAAALLAERYARQRAAEPLLPEIDDFAAQIPEGEGAVATRGGEAVAYVVAKVGAERAEVGFAGCAASEPEALRDVYAAPRARAGRRWHQVTIPAVRRGARRRVVPARVRLPVPDGRARDRAGRRRSIRRHDPRRARPATSQATAGFDRLLWTHQAASPSFSGLDRRGARTSRGVERPLGRADEFPYHRVAELDGRVVGHVAALPPADRRPARARAEHRPRARRDARGRARHAASGSR